ncbi:MAG: proline racemase family protein [Deltaproteobacteria bacterium]|nr:proline racemase family protein [Deltaproteobacteria bacterium]
MCPRRWWERSCVDNSWRRIPYTRLITKTKKQSPDLFTVDPVVTGKAYITGIQQFVVDPNDLLKYGFVVGR